METEDGKPQGNDGEESFADLLGLEILAIYSRKMPLGDDVDLRLVAEKAAGCTGWDIENLCRKAAIVAVEAGCHRVGLPHFLAALGAITPWLTPDMEEGYRRIFREDCPQHYSF